MFPHNSQFALGEFFLMHYADVDANFAPTPLIHYYQQRAIVFLNAYNRLREMLKSVSADGVRTACFESGKSAYGSERQQLREWFSDMNLVLFNKKDGPQLSEFVRLYGVDNFINRVDDRINNYMKLFLIGD